MSEKLRKVGYLRISPCDKNPDIPTQVPTVIGSDQPNMPESNGQLLNLLHSDDELAVYQLDRLSRDEHTLVSLMQQLAAMGVTLIVAPDAQGDSYEK